MELEKLRANIESVRLTLLHSEETTSSCVSALDSFCRRVETLERDLEPINTLTERLLLSQENINKTLVEFEKIEQHFQVFDEVEPILMVDLLSSNTESSKLDLSSPLFSSSVEQKQYLKALDRLTASLIFLNEHRKQIKSANETYGRMKNLQNVAINNICTEYETMVEANAPKCEDYVNYYVCDHNIPLKGFPNSVSVRVTQLAHCIHRNGFAKRYEDIYQSIRSNVLCNAISTIAKRQWPEFKSGNGNTIGSRMKTSVSNFKVNIIESEKKGNENYAKGEFGVIKILQTAVYMIQNERRVSRKVLPQGEKSEENFLL